MPSTSTSIGGSSAKAWSAFGSCFKVRRRCRGRGAPWPPALEQVAGQQAGIAVGVLHRHPALVSQADGDLRPVQPAWPGAGGTAPGCGHRTPPAQACPLAAMASRRRSATSWARPRPGRAPPTHGPSRRWQFQFRYRHTTTSHPA
jgi:hypothetical protein